MDEQLSPEQAQLRDSAARLCADLGGAKRARALRDKGEGFERTAWQAMQQAGWLSALVPEARGGLGLGAVELYVLMEQIGRHAVIAPLLESAAVSRVLGQAAGRAADEALRTVLAGERLILPVLTADGWNFGPGSIALKARQDGDRFRISGTASGVPFAQSADDFLVAIQDWREPVICLLPRKA